MADDATGGDDDDAGRDCRGQNDATLRAGNQAAPVPAPPQGPALADLFAPPPQPAAPLGAPPPPPRPPVAPRRDPRPAGTAAPAAPGSPPPPLLPRLAASPQQPAASPAGPAAARQHRRLLSWGQDVPRPFAADEPLAAVAGPGPPPAAAARARSVQLLEILQSSPYETEAETHILRALERHQQQTPSLPLPRSRAGTLDSGAVWSVADQAAHAFEEAAAAAGDRPPGGPLVGDTGAAADPPPRPAVAVPSSRQSSLGSHPPDGGADPQLAERHPLLAKKPVRLQKRQLSVQDHLQGLTSAMQALDAQDARAQQQQQLTAAAIGPAASDGDSRGAASDRTEQMRREEAQHRRQGSADHFASHAIRLLELAETDAAPTEKPGAGVGGVTQRRWGVMDHNLSILQEDDASDLSQDSGGTEAAAKASENDDSNVHSNLANGGHDNKPKRKKLRPRQRRSVIARTGDALKEDIAIWNKFFGLRKRFAWKYVKNVFRYLILPATAVSAILFYAADNPPTGRSVEGVDEASASWWLLFICVRQMITLLLSLGAQAIIIDFLGLETKILLRLLGPLLSLLIVQSKGWPCIMLFWAVFDFILLQGNSPLAHHWGFFQPYVDLFNGENPSGNIVNSRWNQVVLGTVIGVSAATAVKRFLIGLYQGRQLFTQYGHQLAKLMDKMLLISQVAGLAKDIERASHSPERATWNDEVLRGLSVRDFDDSEDGSVSRQSLFDQNQNQDHLGAHLDLASQSLQQLLDEWEEPDVDRQNETEEDVSISAVLRFRKALFFIQKEYPFSYSFGAASSREECVASAQAVYQKLLLHRPDRAYLHFETIALLALDAKGDFNPEAARELIKLLRPDRDGKLSLVDFVKSIDSVYKKYRLLLASVANTNAIDRAFERIFNFVYYTIVLVVVTTAWGFDPIAIFLSLSSILLAFAFIIGRASASYFEGVLFILVRRPYGIGDRIHVSNIEQETDIRGSYGWIVENITLFETTAVWHPTRERCSLANSSLCGSRIINGARSPQAQFLVPFKFPINTPYDKILIFKAAVEEYMKARPREWLMMTGFRAATISPEQGFIEYVIHIQHRESWQQFSQLQDSRANFQSYCLEVSKQLGMNYSAPPLPVDLRHYEQCTPDRELVSDVDSVTRMEGFRSLAMTQHNIGWTGN